MAVLQTRISSSQFLWWVIFACQIPRPWWREVVT